MIYLDNSTTTRPSSESVSKMLNFYTDKWGVTTQPHKMGQELFPPYTEALKSVYLLLGASEQDAIVMTSSGAQAINHAILSTYQDVSLNEGKNHFITLVTEEAPLLMSFHQLNVLGAVTTLLKPNHEGLITPQQLIEAITPRTCMVALSWANGLTGTIQPIMEIAKICHLRGIRLLVEGSHVLGKHFFALKEYTIDFFSFSGDLLHAPKGTGGLYIKQGIKFSPEPINVPAVVGLGVAAKQMLEARDYFCTEVARLEFEFVKEVLNRLPQAKRLFDDSLKVTGIVTLSFPGIINEALLFALNQKNVFASIGGGSAPILSYYLKTCGFEPAIAESAISFSLSRETTEEEIIEAVNAIEEAVTALGKVSL